ncbi:hypothetical protein CC1G_01014 [Coprinopsis cinerea okayama7|uniref:F-box domain-containing protein n=1 Tax=Coprinopsis cinerea (strain Okayama-7 / 130 / ATCC MYA-4618 / FGSC 9003) TaxID=240176 RepID=A8NE75_COPC7|nr:hypothetical protein CC1G_01014 [Coprinopsis cinerea okayama7\|eukprot:XP_001832952.1 hypothetical protein CC1G_01014 [Coprinopsis cinerea okayama7\
MATSSSNPPFSALDSQIAQLELQVSTLKSQALQLKGRRNDLAPISRLPNEVLCRIAIEYKRSTPLVLRIARKPYRELGWPIVTHIYRRWRHVCLNHPQLWADIKSSDPLPWTATKLGLSRNVPLSLKWVRPMEQPVTVVVQERGNSSESQSSDQWENLLHRATSDARRLREVAFYGPLTFLNSMVNRMAATTHGVPNLRCLSLRHNDVFDSLRHFLSVPDDDLALIPKAASVKLDAPELRQLILWNCNPRINSIPFHNLTDLSLHLARCRKPLSSVEFMEMLKEAQSLVTVDLQQSLPDHYDHTTTEFPPMTVTLPCVEFIRVGDEYRRCITFLQHIRLPSSASVELNCTIGGRGDGHEAIDSDLCPTLSSLWMSQPDSSLQSFKLPVASMAIRHWQSGRFLENHFWCIGFSTEKQDLPHLSKVRRSVSTPPGRSPPKADFKLCIAFGTRGRGDQAVEDFLHHGLFDLTSLQSLHLDLQAEPDAVTYLGSSALLEEVALRSGYASAWFIKWLTSDPLLWPDDESSTTSVHTAIRLPRLRTLHLDCDFNPAPQNHRFQYTEEEEKGEEEVIPVTIGNLLWVLENRAKHGHQPEEIVLYNGRKVVLDEDLEFMTSLGSSVRLHEGVHEG